MQWYIAAIIFFLWKILPVLTANGGIDISKLASNIMLLIAFCCGGYVYYDAKKRGLKKIEGKKSLMNMSPNQWALFAFFFWPITFPIYLNLRKKREAVENGGATN